MRFLLLCLAGAGLWAGEADALSIDRNIRARHMPFGTIIDPFYASPTSDQITGYTRCGDSALWTGAYLAAEAFRFRVTRSAEALDNAREAIAGLQGLVNVTGTGYMARCRFPASSPFAAGIQREEALNGVRFNGPWAWIANTSRDQYCGVVFGLGVAFDHIDDADIRSQIRSLIAQLTSSLIANNFSEPTFLLRPDHILAVLQVAAHIDPARFRSEYESRRDRLAGSVRLPVAFDSLSNSSYFKYNLIYLSFYHLIGLERSAVKAEYEAAYRTARSATRNHRNAFFNMIDRAVTGPDATRDAETRMLLDLWLTRPRRDHYVDLSRQVRVCGDEACEPIPVPLRIPTDFLWQRSPFQLKGGGEGTIGNAGVDYLLPYWMARYYGLHGDFAVQSAAAPIQALAPGSLASLYGSGLDGSAELRLKSSDGTVLTARILYANSTQVNFVVPDKMTAGLAEITLLRNGQQPLTGSALIHDVAPALFSMSSDGSGVAAALAVQVGEGGLQISVPVFSCGTDGCRGTPIELRTGLPVYVSLYGTGFRNADSRSVQVTVNDISVPVEYSGAHSEFAGLDQINFLLPVTLRGAGDVDVRVRVNEVISNTVTLTVR